MPTDPGDREPADRELLRRIATGDLDALTAIYQRYHQVVFRFALAMTASADAAEDIAQEVFVGLVSDARRYDPDRAAFATYLYGIVRNLSRARLRRARRLLSFETVVLAGPEPASDANPMDRIEGAQLVAEVRRALSSLPSRYRELIILCDLHGQSYNDAAMVVGSSVAAVRSRLHRGRHLLRLRLARVAPDRQRDMNPMRCAV